MLLFLILLTNYIVDDTGGTLCPPVFGQFECPLNFSCITNECYSASNATAPYDCKTVKCSPNSRCYKGRCYPAVGLPCDRNVALSEHLSKSITSNCGLKGTCINGRCVEDRCLGTNCTEDEICQDGKCLVVTNTFCITHFDCGPRLKCLQNKCTPFRDPIPCNCDPGEVCQQGHCIPEPNMFSPYLGYIFSGCAHVSCEIDSFCLKGECQAAIGQNCTSASCQGSTICVKGRCILDPCVNHCPPEHACREGQCRHLQGLMCFGECPKPYFCINGRCTRNECLGKSCQPGEMCQSGLCIKVEGSLCSLAIRDCAEEFECIGGTCHDMLVTKDTTSA
uniref:EB domain-containing protein n=1 Tax=Elaeophora elaphi TaxID=1147741 RepID=A0A0R3RI45_9BILA